MHTVDIPQILKPSNPQTSKPFNPQSADYKDLDPALKNYLNGGHHYLMAVGLRLAAVDEWAEAKHGEAVAHIAKSKVRRELQTLNTQHQTLNPKP